MEQRTQWAESGVARLCALPFVAETVFWSLRYLDNRLEKEVCDILLTLRGRGMLLSMKAQEDPSTRNGDRLERWVVKHAEGACNQLRGAVRTLREHPTWCQHLRRGRVDFLPGAVALECGIVLVEHFADGIPLPSSQPLIHGTLPIHYFSLNDFLNLVYELRSWPDLHRYLQQRDRLPEETRRLTGAEKHLLSYYLLHEESFSGWTTPEAVKPVLSHRASDLARLVRERHAAARDAALIERVGDCLAERLAGYTEGLSEDLVRRYDPLENRTHYLTMQEHLCDLSFMARVEFGRRFREASRRVRAGGSGEMVYFSGYPDEKPDFLHVFAATQGLTRQEVLTRARECLRACCAAEGKTLGMIVVDREGENFEVVFQAVGPQVSAVEPALRA